MCLVYCLNRSYLAMSAISDGAVAVSSSGVASLTVQGARAASESIPLIGVAVKALFSAGQYVMDSRKRNQAGRVARRLGYGAAHAETICEAVARTIALLECDKLEASLKSAGESKSGVMSKFERFAKSIKDDKRSPIEEAALERCRLILKTVADASGKDMEVPVSPRLMRV